MAEFIEKIPSEIEDQNSELVVYRINSYPADFTLQGLYDKWNKKEIKIPPFQRGYVWTVSQASKLIESFLLGLPVPGIFFYREPESQKLLVIDGQQRLRTVFNYFDGKLPDSNKKFYLRNVNPKWLGKTFEDLIEADKIRLKDSVLRATIVEQIDPKDNTSIFHIFERLNTGGTVLKPQEVRNCLFHGEFNNLLKELNNNGTWRRLIGITTPDKRMRDIELILRFFALYHEHRTYKKPMKDFLSDFMARYKNNTKAVEEFRDIFEKTITCVNQQLGATPFRIKAGLNAAIFDSVMVAFALNLNKKIPSDIKERYKQLLKEEAFIDFISEHTTDTNVVKQRIKLATERLFY